VKNEVKDNVSFDNMKGIQSQQFITLV